MADIKATIYASASGSDKIIKEEKIDGMIEVTPIVYVGMLCAYDFWTLVRKFVYKGFKTNIRQRNDTIVVSVYD